MKILFYNLGYGRGHDGSLFNYIVKAHRFFLYPKRTQRKVLDGVFEILKDEEPDVFAYAEISTGSFRNKYFNQHQYLVENMPRGVVAESAVSKYGETVLNIAPFHTGNANGVVSHLPAEISECYLRKSRKKLVYKIELKNLTVFAVHLPLVSSDRIAQLVELSEMVNETKGNVVVCGDFNIFDGIDELKVITDCTELETVGEKLLTFPSYKPRLLLDVFLYRFEDINIKPRMRVLDEQYSDHLPIILEW